MAALELVGAALASRFPVRQEWRVILLVDNYDSFTFNLVQSLELAGAEVVVRRNDQLGPGELSKWPLDAVVLSPGPGGPAEAGRCLELLAELPLALPVLGVCLGHQILVQHYGGRLEFDPEPVHGRATSVLHNGERLFAGLPNPMPAGRYHSIRAAELPPELVRTAWTEQGIVMGVEHRSAPRFGVQFHPESILTPAGDRLIANFVNSLGRVEQESNASVPTRHAGFGEAERAD